MSGSDHQSYAGHGNGLGAAARTHPGKVRSINQDTFVCEPERGLFAVIDGMGGTLAGEVAAATARQAVLDYSVPDRDPRESLDQANRLIHERAARNPDEHGMGCVATVARVEGPELVLAHVGDTRALLVSSAGCEQLTRDHTVVADIQEQQGLSDTMAAALPGQHQVTRDIGGRLHDDTSWVDTARVPFEVGDLLVLCSDGLSDLVGDKELFALLWQARKENRAVKELVDRLIELALERGARDNVTVAAIHRDKMSTPPKSVSDRGKVENLNRPPPSPKSAQRRRAGGVFRFLILAAALAGFGICGFFLYEEWKARNVVAPETSPDTGPDVDLPEPASAGSPQATPSDEEGGIAGAVAAGAATVPAGAAGLDATLDADAELTALGPLRIAAEQSRTVMAPGVSLTLHGARLEFPAAPAVWEIHLGAGSTLVLRQISVRAPQLALTVIFDDANALLRIEDSHLEVATLRASGPAGSRLEVTGGRLYLRDGGEAIVDGPDFLGQIEPDPPLTNPEDNGSP